jgi:acyl carrier protein
MAVSILDSVSMYRKIEGGVYLMVDVAQRIIQLIAEQLDKDVSEITPEMSFADDLGADSLDLVELIMTVEEEFNIEIPDDEAEKIKFVKDAINYVTSRL